MWSAVIYNNLHSGILVENMRTCIYMYAMYVYIVYTNVHYMYM